MSLGSDDDSRVFDGHSDGLESGWREQCEEQYEEEEGDHEKENTEVVTVIPVSLIMMNSPVKFFIIRFN